MRFCGKRCVNDCNDVALQLCKHQESHLRFLVSLGAIVDVELVDMVGTRSFEYDFSVGVEMCRVPRLH